MEKKKTRNKYRRKKEVGIKKEEIRKQEKKKEKGRKKEAREKEVSKYPRKGKSEYKNRSTSTI